MIFLCFYIFEAALYQLLKTKIINHEKLYIKKTTTTTKLQSFYSNIVWTNKKCELFLLEIWKLLKSKIFRNTFYVKKNKWENGNYFIYYITHFKVLTLQIVHEISYPINFLIERKTKFY